MAINLKSYNDVLMDFISRFRKRRLDMNLTQSCVANRANVCVGVIKHFEKTGKITLDKLFAIAQALGCLDEFDRVLAANNIVPTNLFEDTEIKTRQRGKLK